MTPQPDQILSALDTLEDFIFSRVANDAAASKVSFGDATVLTVTWSAVRAAYWQRERRARFWRGFRAMFSPRRWLGRI